jgi:hypothetical protein
VFGRKTRARLDALERDWSPLINAVLGDMTETERRITERFRAQTDELIRRQVEAEAIAVVDHERIDQLELAVEDRKARPLFGPRKETG